MEQDEKFMREALSEAQAARADGEIPIGAVVVLSAGDITRPKGCTTPPPMRK